MVALDERNEIIIKYAHLVKSMARSYSKLSNIDVEELESYGYEGLWFALKNASGPKKYSYIMQCIHGYILKGISYISGYTSSEFYYDFIKIKVLIEQSKKSKLDDNPELIYDVVDFMLEKKLISEKFVDKFPARFFINCPLSLDAYNEENELKDESLEYDVSFNIIRETIYKLLNELKERERLVIIRRYGLDGNAPKTYHEIGKELNISHEGVRISEKRALDLLRKENNIKKLEGFLDVFDQHVDQEYHHFNRGKVKCK